MSAPVPSAVVASSAMSSTVEPAPAVAVVVVMAAIIESPVVATLGPASIASSAVTARTQDEICDHDHHDYTQNYEQRSHQDPPFPDSRI